MNKKLLQFIFFLLLFLIVRLVPTPRDCTLNIDNCQCQWIQQNLPVPTAAFMDMKFMNANIGFIAQHNNSTGANTFLKTTDSGFNWQVINNFGVSSISLIDSMYVYVNGQSNSYGKLYKSSNCAVTWDSLIPAYDIVYTNLYFFNRDTGLISGSDSYNSFVWRTTDGGISKNLVYTISGPWPGNFFFLKEKVNGEYYGWLYTSASSYLFQTSNSGVSWQTLPNFPDFIYKIFFINKDTGWATIPYYRTHVLYTINGGYNWLYQNLPSDEACFDMYFVNQNKGWICRSDNIIYATTNSGNVWGIQNLQSLYSGSLFFIDSLIGWTGNGNSLSHTTNGGGSINSISLNNQNLPDKYKLFQNYPNPFNQFTIINYQCTIKSNILLKVYDISGNEIKTIVNEKKNQGTYEIRFDGSNLASGVYFYSLSVNGILMETRKMIYLK